MCHHDDQTALTTPPASSATRRGALLLGGRRGLRVFAPALILLGVCVFAWGLRYKLSFYSHPHSATHHVQEAKLLLTDRSATPVAALHRSLRDAAPPAIPLWIPVLLLLAGVFFLLTREWAPDPDRVHRSQRWLFASSGFIRPPPRS